MQFALESFLQILIVLVTVACAYAAVYGLRWRLFATWVRGTMIGMREGAGPEFVAVYEYTDHAGVTRQGTTVAGPTLPDEQKAGATVRLLVFSDRPDMVREGTQNSLGVVVSIVALALCWSFTFSFMPGWAALLVSAGATALGVGVAVRWSRETQNWFEKYGPVERLDEISEERMAAARRYFEEHHRG